MHNNSGNSYNNINSNSKRSKNNNKNKNKSSLRTTEEKCDDSGEDLVFDHDYGLGPL
jgi:hypothetical protein